MWGGGGSVREAYMQYYVSLLSLSLSLAKLYVLGENAGVITPIIIITVVVVLLFWYCCYSYSYYCSCR